jgi:hypothetical protein
MFCFNLTTNAGFVTLQHTLLWGKEEMPFLRICTLPEHSLHLNANFSSAYKDNSTDERNYNEPKF